MLDVQLLDAAKMHGRMLPAAGKTPPILMMEFTAADGQTVVLRDYATAGEGGAFYTSWLKVKNTAPTPFSEAHPWRTARAAQ